MTKFRILNDYGFRQPLTWEEINALRGGGLMTENEKTKPENKHRAGGVVATTWLNKTEKDGETYENYNVVLERSYKDKDGNWKSTSSLRLADIPKAVVLLQEAYKDIVMKTSEKESE